MIWLKKSNWGEILSLAIAGLDHLLTPSFFLVKGGEEVTPHLLTWFLNVHDLSLL
jgi:hypothetical protein